MQKWFLRTFSPRLGYARAINMYFKLWRWAWIALSVVVIFSMTAAYFFYTKPRYHEHAGYEYAEVLGITSQQNKFMAQAVTLRFRLDSGKVLQVVSGALGNVGVGDKICLEKRRYKESQEQFFQVTKPEKCDT